MMTVADESVTSSPPFPGYDLKASVSRASVSRISVSRAIGFEDIDPSLSMFDVVSSVRDWFQLIVDGKRENIFVIVYCF